MLLILVLAKLPSWTAMLVPVCHYPFSPLFTFILSLSLALALSILLFFITICRCANVCELWYSFCSWYDKGENREGGDIEREERAGIDFILSTWGSLNTHLFCEWICQHNSWQQHQLHSVGFLFEFPAYELTVLLCDFIKINATF